MTEYLHKDAMLSSCGRFRYRLERRWDKPGRVLVCVGLNPSTADALEDDATIQVLVGWGKRNGYASLLMLNLYAWRATDSAELRRRLDQHYDWQEFGLDPPGPYDCQGTNDSWLLNHLNAWGPPVAVWGNAPYARQREVAAMAPRWRCFGVNRDGSPWHPLRRDLSTGLWPWAPSLLPL